MAEWTEQLIYREKYGHLPSTRDELLELIERQWKLDHDKIAEEEDKILSIPWEKIYIEALIVPKGTPRPRWSPRNNHFYVKGAKETKDYFARIIQSNRIICTRVNYSLTVYMPTPVSTMSHTEVYLAEKGIIRPTTTSDWDNLAKTYTDCLQGILLINDNIINPGRVEKFFSLKPRVEIEISYQCGFDSRYNAKKAEGTKAFKQLQSDGRLYDNGIFLV